MMVVLSPFQSHGFRAYPMRRKETVKNGSSSGEDTESIGPSLMRTSVFPICFLVKHQEKVPNPSPGGRNGIGLNRPDKAVDPTLYMLRVPDVGHY
jgi:hypothetical protein